MIGTPRHTISGMTRVEAVVSVTVTMLVSTLLLGIIAGAGRVKSDRGQCYVRLRWLGVGLSQYADDHGGKLPWEIPLGEGGSSAYVSVPFTVFRHYLCASNYLGAPSLLVCPQDERHHASSWESMDDSRISYFVNVKAQLMKSRCVVGGDRYLTTNSMMLRGLLDVKTNSHLKWARDFHGYSGHLLFTDGGVALVRSNVVQQFLNTTHAENRLAIP